MVRISDLWCHFVDQNGRADGRRFVSTNPDAVRFYLYSYPNRFALETGYELNVHDLNSIRSSGIHPDVPLKVIVHGFSHNYTCWFPQEVKDSKPCAFLEPVDVVNLHFAHMLNGVETAHY